MTNLLVHVSCWCTSPQTAVNLCSNAALLFFERSLARVTARRRSSPGSQHRPGLTPSSTLSSSVSGDYWIYLIGFSFLCIFIFLIWFFFFSPRPQTHKWDGNLILFPAGFDIGFSGTSCSVILIETWSPSLWNIQPQLKWILLGSVD